MRQTNVQDEMKRFLPLFMRDNDCISPMEINNGYCNDFAFLINERLKKQGLPELTLINLYSFVDESFNGIIEDTNVWETEKMALYGASPDEFERFKVDLRNQDTRGYIGYHVWLYDGKKHYDGECSQGVESPLKLPFFQRFL